MRRIGAFGLFLSAFLAPALAQQTLTGSFSVDTGQCDAGGDRGSAQASVKVVVQPSLSSLASSGGSFSGPLTGSGTSNDCGDIMTFTVSGTLSGTVGSGGVVSFTLSAEATNPAGANVAHISATGSGTTSVLSGNLTALDSGGGTDSGPITLATLDGSSLAGSISGGVREYCGNPAAGDFSTGQSTFSAFLVAMTQPSLNSLSTAGGQFTGSVSGGGLASSTCPDSSQFTVNGSISGTVSPGGNVSWTYTLNLVTNTTIKFSGSGSGTASMLSANGTLLSTQFAGPISYSIVLSAAGPGGSLPPLQIPGGGGSSQVTLPGGTVGVAYAQTLPVAGGNGNYFFRLAGGALPAGLTLNTSGFLSGTPTQAGGYLFTATVNNGTTSASSTFAVTVAAQAVTITTKSLPNASVNGPYPPQTLTASGGIPPYMFQVTGTLPSGLTFSNGVLSGAPSAAGNFTIPVVVTDSSSPAQTASAQLALTVSAGANNLILSQNSVTFTLPNAASTLPPGARISVQSSSASSVIGYSIAVNPTVPWLNVQAGFGTPGAINVNLTPAALNVGASTQTSIVVTCAQTTPCPGGSQTITVSLNRITAATQLVVTTPALAFVVNSANPQPVTQSLGLQNTGGGAIYINSLSAADNYVTIQGNPISLEGGPPFYLFITVDPSKLKLGYYQSSVTVVTSAGTITVPLTVLVTSNANMTLNPGGTIFNAQAGSLPGNPNGSFQVSVTGNSAVSWTARVLPGADWLTLNTASGTSTAANPGAVTFTINSAAANLGANPYYAAIEVSSPAVVDSPQTFIVVLNIVSAITAVAPDPQPAGLLFIAASGTPAAQTVKVYAGTTASLPFQAASDSSWLSVTPKLGNTSSTSPATTTVSVNLQGLKAGIYTGGVSYSLSGAAVRTVNVTLILEPGAVVAGNRGGLEPRAACTPARLVAVENGLVNSFSQPSAWPTPLSILLVNDCGQPVTNGQVVATFSNGDAPLVLPPADTTTGTYSATWTPRNTSQQIAITVKAFAPTFPAAATQIAGQVTPNAAPLLTPGGTLNAFAIASEPGVPFSPGQIVQIYGSNLASQAAQGGTIPLPTTINNTSVIVGGMQAPLYYVSPGQINAQIPFELKAGNPYQLIINANGALSTPYPVQLVSDSPGIAQFAGGKIIAQHPDYSLVTESAPAKPGEYLTIYLVGMGGTDQAIVSGTASPSASLANAIDKPTLTLDGSPVTTVPFAGLTPTAVALYQVNFQVPTSAANGDLSLVITQASGVTKSTVLPVHN